MATYYNRTNFLGTEDINSNRVPLDISNKIYELDADRAPFLLLTTKAGKESCHNYKFFGQEQEMPEYKTTTSTVDASAGANTTLTVAEPAIFIVDDIVLAPRIDELMQVTAVDTVGGTITVTRDYGGTGAGTLADGDELVILGDANEQGSGSRDIVSRMIETPWNVTQIFKTPYGMDRTQQQTKTYGEMKEWARIAREASKVHKEKIERAFLFGERKIDTSGSKPKTMTRGITRWIQTNVDDQSGAALTETNFDKFLAEKAFAHGSTNKVLLASRLLLRKIDGFAKANIRTKSGIKKYGLNITQYESTFGTLDLIEHKFLTGDVYGAYGIVVDMSKIKFRYMQDTINVPNIQANDEDGRKDQYLTEAGLQVAQEKCHAIIKNFT